MERTYLVIRNSNFGHLTGLNEVTVLETNDKVFAELHATRLEQKGFTVRIEDI